MSLFLCDIDAMRYNRQHFSMCATLNHFPAETAKLYDIIESRRQTGTTMTQLVFFDLDGTLSVPEYEENGKPVIGFHTPEGWVNYCNAYGDKAYQFCKPLQPVKRYALQKKEEGARLFVLTAVLCESEVGAKKVFLDEHYPGIFEDMITVGSAGEKGEKIKEIAAREDVPLDHCELVEDTFMTLLDVMEDGVRVTHLSEIVCNY